MKKYSIPAGVVVIIVIAVIMLNEVNTPEIASSTSPSTSTAGNTSALGSEERASSYKNGTYSQMGSYVSPGGPREVIVTITLDSGIITNSDFEGLATDPTSQRFQGEFADSYEAMVVGRNIDEVELSKVAGSSLTSQGFNDALAKIKEQAQT